MAGSYYIIGGLTIMRRFSQVVRKVVKTVNPDNPRILYFDVGNHNQNKFARAFEEGFLKIYPRGSFSMLDISPFEPAPDDLQNEIDAADVIHFEGAEKMAYLRAAFREHALGERFADACAAGKLVGGLCGGGSILASRLVYSEGDTILRDDGAGAIAGTAITCKMDFTPEWETRLRYLRAELREGFCSRALGVGENHALLISPSGAVSYVQGEPSKTVSAFALDERGEMSPLPEFSPRRS